MTQQQHFTAKRVWFDDERVFVELNDGRIVGSPLRWFPLLAKATPEQRNHYELVGDGYAIRWDELNEDLSVNGFLSYTRP